MLKNKVSEKGEFHSRRFDENSGAICLNSGSYHPTEKNKKRDVRNWFNPEPGTNSNEQYRQQEIPVDNYDVQRRGDIPVMHGDCEGKNAQVH